MTHREKMIEHFAEQRDCYLTKIVHSEHYLKNFESFTKSNMIDELIEEEKSNLNYYKGLAQWYTDSINELK